MAKTYIKKPMPIEAVQFTGKNFDEVKEFCPSATLDKDELQVKTLEGVMKAPNKVGDYVIKGVVGEFYICDKDIFEKTYEEVNERNCVCASAMY